MRHIPVFRWFLALGLALITWSGFLYVTAPDFPELEQVDLTVLEEKPDGTCRVSYANPFAFDDEREEPYRCDPRRSSALKAPEWDPETGFGWDSGWVVAEGPDQGELYSLDEDGKAYDEQIERSDTFIMAGLVLTVTGLVGGNIRSLRRIRGVRPGVLRRATQLKEAAGTVARDHRRALEDVRTAWAPLHRELVDGRLGRIPVSRMRGLAETRLSARELEKGGVRTVRDVLDAGTWALAQFLGMERDAAERTMAEARRTADTVGREVTVRFEARGPDPRTTALLAALRVLVDAGPDAREAGRVGAELVARLEPLLITAEPASGVREMLRTGPYERENTLAAVTQLRLILDRAGRERLAERFAQASVDLLRGPDAGADQLATWTDFESRPAAYYAALAEAVENEAPERTSASAPIPDGAGLTGSRRRR
ncbi:hypothetical protein ACFXOR_11545 [Streptomyces sp. NPDC059164]|uniref:hypothetical protein n=1 Tax=Streptomyces sp. NPDC059164 TaxID=3346750 RepID=UPI00367AAF14